MFSREGSGGRSQAAVAGLAGHDEEHGPGTRPEALLCFGMALSEAVASTTSRLSTSPLAGM